MSEYRKYAQYSKKKEIKQTGKLSKEGEDGNTKGVTSWIKVIVECKTMIRVGRPPRSLKTWFDRQRSWVSHFCSSVPVAGLDKQDRIHHSFDHGTCYLSCLMRQSMTYYCIDSGGDLGLEGRNRYDHCYTNLPSSAWWRVVLLQTNTASCFLGWPAPSHQFQHGELPQMSDRKQGRKDNGVLQVIE